MDKETKKLMFENIFEGNDIKPEMKDKIASLLNDVVDRKVEARLAEEKEDDEDEEDDDEKQEEEYSQNPDNKENNVLTNEDEDEEEKDDEEGEEEEEEEYSQNPENKEHNVLTNEEEPEEEDEEEDPEMKGEEEEPEEEPEEEEEAYEEEEPEEDEKEVKEEEGHLTPNQIKKRDQIAKAIMRGKEGLEKRYGAKRAKGVAYATATQLAMQEEEEEASEDEAAVMLDKIHTYFSDPEAAKVARAAAGGSLSKLTTSMKQLFKDLKDNGAAREGVKYVVAIMKQIQDDPTLANRLTSDIKKDIKQQVQAEMEEQVSQQIDKYLTYVAEQWAEENKLALENGIKVQLAESFLKKFDELYAQFNFKAVPERDMVVEMTQKVVEAENRLNEEVEKNATLLEKMNKQKKDNLINEATKGLTATQVEKFKKLVENVTFENASSFEQKLQTIKETAFTKEVLKSDTTLDEEAAPQLPSNPRMDKYVDAISKNLKF